MRDIATETGIKEMLQTICLSPEQRDPSGYAAFLERKNQMGTSEGFAPIWMPDFLFDFQASLCDYGIRKGRAAMFADAGLGKTPMSLVWAENVVRMTNKPVLILTPLAVSFQFIWEAEKFGVDAIRGHGKVTPGARIVVTNYEQLHKFSPHDFAGIVCDESARIKAFDAKTCTAVLGFARSIPYRLLGTATPAPNDYVELGTSAEALGVCRSVEMLVKYFIHDSGDTGKWRLKKHAARIAFWQWLASWARAVRKPSDLGFSDERFVLPPLVETLHMVKAARPSEGLLFTISAIGLNEQREERRRTLEERCQKVADLINPTGKPAIAWCHLNPEGDLLEKLIPDAIQVSGRDSDETKEEKLMAFMRGHHRVLVTKGKIAGWGLNLQHCAHMTLFPSHSFEERYQIIRRCYRFGQVNPVHVDTVTTEGEQLVLQNLQRKAKQADVMFSALTKALGAATIPARAVQPPQPVTIPSWL